MTTEAMSKPYPDARPARIKVHRRTPVAWFRTAYSVTTVNHRGHDLLTHTFPTWADAMAFADRLARFIRTSHQITEGTDR